MKPLPATSQEGLPAPEARAESARRTVSQAIDVVRVDTATDQLPIWAPSHYADEKSRTYQISWIGEDASVTVQSSGEYGMLRAFDKVVLMALVQCWNDQGRNPEGFVYFHVGGLIASLDRKPDGRTYEHVKDSLNRLRFCGIQYKKSFKDGHSREWLTMRGKTILEDLFIVEPIADPSSLEESAEGYTSVQLDFHILANLVGDFTRPLSLMLLKKLSERGVLFESYVQSVLFKQPYISKDVFTLWEDLGLSTKGIQYASKLAHKMKPDLDAMVDDPSFILGKYSFEKSKTRRGSQNLVLHRSRTVKPTTLPAQYRTSDTGSRSDQSSNQELADRLVTEIRLILHDESANDTNIRLIAARLDRGLVLRLAHDAWAYYRDGHCKNPAAYFVGMARKRAAELGVDLGFQKGESLAAPKPINPRSSEPDSNELARFSAKLADQFKTGSSDE